MNVKEDHILELEVVSMDQAEGGNERQGLLPSLVASSSEPEAMAATTVAKAEAESPSGRIQERAASNGHASSRQKRKDEVVFADAGTPPSRRKQHDESAALFANIPFSASLILGPGTQKPVTQMSHMRRYYSIFVFTLTASLLYADQNLMAPLLTPIAAEFGFNDEEKDRYLGGYIAALFFAVGAPSAMLVGYLCDRMNRRNLLFIVVVLGEGPCLATFFVRRYWQLLMLRVLTGVSVGGTLPLVYSLVGDLFSAKSRASVAAGIQVATGVGLASGQAISGFVGPHTGWRWPFVIVAIPALLLSVLMIFTTNEPARGAAESALQEQYEHVEGFEYEERLTWQKVWTMVRIPSNICVILQGLPGSLPWGVLLTFLNDFLFKDQGLSIETGTLIVLWWGLGGGVGVIGGGFIGQFLYNRRPAYMPVFVGSCVCLAPLPIWFLLNARLAEISLFWSLLAAFIGGLLASPPGPNARAVLLNVNEPEGRGFVLGLMTVLDDVGKGMGPFLVSLLIQLFKRRRPAFNIAVGGWIPCGIIFGLAAITLAQDEISMQDRLRSKVILQPVSIVEDEVDEEAEDEVLTDVPSRLEAETPGTLSSKGIL